MKYPSSYSKDPEEKRMGILVKQFKLSYNLGRLSKDEIELCESIPEWKWKEKLYNRAYEYKKLKWQIINGFNNYELIYRIRKLYKNNRLSQEEIAICESIPNWRWYINPFQTKEDIENILTKAKHIGIIKYCKENNIKYSSLYLAMKRFKIKNGHRKIFNSKQEVLDFIEIGKNQKIGITKLLEQEEVYDSVFKEACKRFNIKWDYRILRFKKLLTLEDIKDFIERFNKSPLKLMEFCKEENIHSQYFYRSLKNLNIERNNNKSRPIEKLILKDNTLIKIEGKPYSPKKTDAKKIKKIRKMLKDGMIYKDIASELNVSIALISSYNPNKRYRKSGYKIRKLDYLEKGGDLCEDKGKTRKGKSIIHQMSESMS